MIFRKIEIEDRKQIKNILNKYDGIGQEFSFEALYLLDDTYESIHYLTNYEWIIIRFKEDEGYSYLPICEEQTIEDVFTIICTDAKMQDSPLLFICRNLQVVEWVDKLYPNRFEPEVIDSFSDYIYSIEDFAVMEGAKNKHKRNKVNKFLRNYPKYEVVKIREQNLHRCIELLEIWGEKKELQAKERSDSELLFCLKTFEQFELLDIDGLLLLVEGIPVSFVINCTLGNDTVIALIAKHNINYDGSNLFIKHLCYMDYMNKGYLYVNFCDDSNSLSLREAKKRLNPSQMIYRYLISEI